MKRPERMGQGSDQGCEGVGVGKIAEWGATRGEKRDPDRRVPDEPTLRPVRDLGDSASVPCLLPAPGLSPIRASPP